MQLTGCRADGGQSRGARTLKIEDVEGYVEMVARQNTYDQEPKSGSGDTRTEETIFEENLRLETDGYLYHPNLLEFSLGGLFGLIQQDFEEITATRERTSRDDGSVLEFDLDAQILKKKSYPLTVSAHRRRAYNPRPFLPSLETTTTDYNVIWQYVSEKVPTTFQFQHTDVRLTPLSFGGEAEQDGRQTNTLFRFETAYNFNDFNTLSLTYRHESAEEEPFTLRYDSDEVTLAHRLDFGEGHVHQLDSELNYHDQRGTLDTDRVRWRESLELQHSDTLRSRYRLEALERTRGSRSPDVRSRDERSVYVAGTLEHQLYESLTSQITGTARFQRLDPDIRIERLGARAGFTYRKKNPWSTLQAGYRAGIQQNERRGEDQRAEIIDESHFFRDPEAIVLQNPNIQTSTIVIRAEDRVTLYQEDRDYTVRDFGNRVEIERIPTGRISDGETVLIDYIFEVPGSFTLDTVSQNFNIRQVFPFGLAPYYRLEWQDQTVSPARVDGIPPDDRTVHVVGVDFERASLKLNAEYEDRDSTIDPLRATRLGASYAHRFKSGATGGADLRWSDTKHGLPVDRDVELLTLRGRYRHPITANLTVEGTVLYRLGEDSLTGEDEGLDLFFSLEWLVRETEVRITFEFDQFDDDIARNEATSLYVQVRRHF